MLNIVGWEVENLSKCITDYNILCEGLRYLILLTVYSQYWFCLGYISVQLIRERKLKKIVKMAFVPSTHADIQDIC